MDLKLYAIIKKYIDKKIAESGSGGSDIAASAYAYAKQLGFTGTENDFALKLAELSLVTDANEVAY